MASAADRYLIAYAQFCIDFGASEQRVCETLVGLRDGRPIKPEELNKHQIEWLEKNPGGWFAVDRRWDEAKHPHQKDEWRKRQKELDLRKIDWSEAHLSRKGAETMTKRLRRLRSKPLSDKNFQWLASMTEIFHCTIRGLDKRLGYVKFLAEKIGETKYFDLVLEPILLSRSEKRAEGVSFPLAFTAEEAERIVSPGF